VAAGFLLGSRAADEEDGPFLRAAVTAAVSPVAPSDALTARCTVCAAQDTHRGHISESAFFMFDPESDVEEQMSLSRTSKRCKNSYVHALMLKWSCRLENGATPKWNSVM